MPLIAGAVASAAWSWFARLWPLWLGIGLVVFGAIALNVHDKRVAREAVAAVEAEYKARLSQCEETKRQAALAIQEARSAIDTLQQSYAEQSARVIELVKAEAAAKARGDRAVAQALAKERALLGKIAELKAEAEKPAATPELSCEEADAILRDLAARRAGG